MGWNLAAWLVLGRTAQLLGSLVSVVSHGYFTVRLKDSRHGLSKETTVLELLACLLLGYSILALIIQQASRRSQKTRWLKAFVVCDVLLVAVLLGIINVLARAGLPIHCAGLTRGHLDPDVVPLPGFTTIGFSDEDPGQRGELDKFCGFARPYYVIANILVFTYMFTITATMLHVLQSEYTKNTKVGELLESLERADGVRLKLVDSSSPPEESHCLDPPPPPPSEGIITRTTSLRSNFTTSTTSATPSHTGASGVPPIPRRPIGQPPALPRRPVPSTSLFSPSRAANNPGAGLAPPPLGDDENAEAALVTDGMRHPPRAQHHHQRSLSRDPSSQPAAFPRMPMLSEEDQSADAALVSDGMRPSDPALPPYQPGNRRMSGHSGDNEMRLSGYVKGQTRAQNMKDSGGY
ncbi:hypothetical protein MYCTH_2134741 [Thermothelomyces thermophilus ATCC 42464]|uniref:Uncharacterized protein n=1 Tax=Thermothelomyces thermophilus (strain ATCC 42464 / BCRC 31852 / DSM 1799) TaxID=573729 RepID=G2QEY4_THET4|nr:uncharacterized protein MYCTH_2134741 [Thermothelomyces thermophilus ATCC 42464]AEO59013.1 hypothetical protein MYCTH_2134741 [Thermothelomyces thermophilus ATCC 42464]